MKRLLYAVLGLALLAAAPWVVSLSLGAEEPRSAFVPGGQGAWPLVEDAELAGLEPVRLLSSPTVWTADASLDPASTVLVVVNAARPYAQREADAIAAFVEAGGGLVVADAFGQGNTLLGQFGLVFERVRLVESSGHPTAQTSLDDSTFTLWLDAPTPIEVSADLEADVLGSSSATSFADKDGDGLIDASDPQGPFPIVVEVAVGSAGGRVVAVGDASPFLPDGADRADNRAWRRALLTHLLPSGGTLVIDESRDGTTDPVLAAFTFATAAGQGQSARLLWIAAAVAALAILLPTVRSDWLPHRFRPRWFLRRQSLEAGAPVQHRTWTGGRWTNRGALALATLVALACVALVMDAREAAGVASGVAVLLAASLLVPTPVVNVRRRVRPARAEEGSDVDVHLEIGGPGTTRGRTEFRDALPMTFEVVEGTTEFTVRTSRHPTVVAYKAQPAVAGAHDIGPLIARRKDPFALRERRVLVGRSLSLPVAPRADAVRRVPVLTRVPTVTLGPHLVNRAGEGSEFHALRQYQAGDPFRSVNWKASARSPTLMVNQRVHESMAWITLFIDTRGVAAAGPANANPFIVGARAAVSLASGALRARDRIRIVLYGDGVRVLPPGPGSQQLRDLTEILSQSAAGGTTGLIEAVREAGHEIRPRTPAVVITGLEGDASLLDGVQALRKIDALPVVVAPALSLEPSDPEDGGPEPESEAVRAERAERVRELHGLGIPVFEMVDDMPLDFLLKLGGRR